ncbi:outer membrane lipoprotein [Dyella lipolytica]|nr:lipocalin family protein [Dyella lipolytica]GLQ45957.1 outer membrane lipoprotein [Dyella lipolytica]
MSKTLLASCGFMLASMNGCASDLPPIQPVSHVDLTRFMGSWYVIATIPTRFEKNAYNAVETYTLQSDGNVYTAFRFNNGSFSAPEKKIHSLGIVKANTGNAVWGVQLFWPLRAQYIVAYLSQDYSETIVARDARDYTWIMARTPNVSPHDYVILINKVKALGYDISKIRNVPQQWSNGSDDPVGVK